MVATAPISDPVAQILEYQILPFVITAERLWKRPEYLLFTTYSYCREVLGGIAGLGLAGPIAAYAELFKDGKISDPHASATVLTGIGVGLIVLIIVLRVVFTKRDLERRAVLAEACRKEFQALNTRVIQALTGQDVRDELKKLRNEVSDIFRRHSSDGSYPYAIAEPGIEPLVRERTQYMLKQIVQLGPSLEQAEVPREQRIIRMRQQ